MRRSSGHEIAEPIGRANGDEPFRSVSIPSSVAAHPRRSPRSLDGSVCAHNKASFARTASADASSSFLLCFRSPSRVSIFVSAAGDSRRRCCREFCSLVRLVGWCSRARFASFLAPVVRGWRVLASQCRSDLPPLTIWQPPRICHHQTRLILYRRIDVQI